MMTNYLRAVLMMCSPFSLAATSYYCPQNHAYINVGMTQDQVIAACGQPSSRQSDNNPVVQQIPVTQLIYSNLNQGPVDFYPGLKPVYDMFSLPSGSLGINIQVNLINNRVSDITVNQAHTNGLSACSSSGAAFQIGDDINAVFAACGSPNMINNTYINQPVPKSQHPQVWNYDIPYQSSISLTFINGILQSIN